MEKLPNADDFSLSAQFCRYYELDDIKRAFEIFFEFSYSRHSDRRFFFAADSRHELVLLHKRLSIKKMDGNGLAEEIAVFAETLRTVRSAWKKGELDGLADTARPLTDSQSAMFLKI